MSKMVSRARACASAKMMEEAFDDSEMLGAIKDDYKRRHRG
jgi:hypothetical protein